jgi:hypothetical protein
MNPKYEFLILLNKLDRWYSRNEYSIIMTGTIVLMSIGVLSILIEGC